MPAARLSSLFFTAALLFSAGRVAAQVGLSPGRPGKDFFAVKAFGLPTFLFIAGDNASFGLEHGFRKRHSVGASFAYTRFAGKYSSNDSTQVALGSPYSHHIDRGLLIYYRYYAKSWSTIWKSIALYRPYTSAFVRLGNADRHFDEHYETDQIKYDERQLSIGALLGTAISPERGRLCIDVNAGPFYKWKSVKDIKLVNGAAATASRSSAGVGLKIGLTLMYVFERPTCGN